MAELRFSRSLYAPDAVRQAVVAFGGLATLAVDEQEHELRVSVSNPHPKVADRIEDELANYALGLTAQAGEAR